MFKSTLVALVLATFFTPAFGAESAVETASPPGARSTRKHELIAEFIKVSKLDERAQYIYQQMLAEVQRGFGMGMKQAINANPKLSEEQKQQASLEALSANNRMFNRYKELLDQKLNFPKMMEDITYDLYDKHFTESELQDIVNFYKTPTAQKFTELSPKITAEASALTHQRIDPIMKETINEVVKEERERPAPESK
jgi:hypothetical protein